MKILLIENNITNQTALNNGVVMAKKWLSSIGFTADFVVSKNLVDIKSIPFTNPQGNTGYQPDPSALTKYLTGYDAVVYVYDWDKLSPKPTNPTDNGNIISIPCQWFMQYPEVFAEFLLHEICHLIFFKANKPDTTHDYVQAFTQKQRYEYYLHLLNTMKEFWIEIVDATIIRVGNPYITPGEITIKQGGATFQCKTLELKKCIPDGTYKVKWTFSPRFMKYTYELQNVKGYTGIRIHSGNYAWGKQVDRIEQKQISQGEDIAVLKDYKANRK